MRKLFKRLYSGVLASALAFGLAIPSLGAAGPAALFLRADASQEANGVVSASAPGETTGETRIDLTENYLSSPNIRFYGRTRYETGKGVRMNAGASGFKVTFTGTELAAEFAAEYCNGQKVDATAVPDTGYTCVKVMVDGEPSYLGKIIRLDGGAAKKSYTLVSGLSEGVHTVEVRKTSEAQHAHASVFSVTAKGNAPVFSTPAPEKTTRKIEVYGDSLSSGYNALGSSVARMEISNSVSVPYYQSCENYNYHCSAVDTYAYYAAKAFGAEINVNAYEGVTMTSNRSIAGMCAASEAIYNWNKNTDYYRYCDAGYHFKSGGSWTFGEWDFDSYIPDVVLVNLGSNDYFLGQATIVNDFYSSYGRFLEKLSAAYGDKTQFVLIYDMVYLPTWYANMRTDLKNAVEKVCSDFKAAHPAAKVTTLDASKVYASGTDGDWAVRQSENQKSLHPYYTEHMEIAEQCIVPCLAELMEWDVKDTDYTSEKLNNDYTLYDGTVLRAYAEELGWAEQVWPGATTSATSMAVSGADGIRVPYTAQEYAFTASDESWSNVVSINLTRDDAVQAYRSFPAEKFGGLAFWVSVPALERENLGLTFALETDGKNYGLMTDTSVTLCDTRTGKISAANPLWQGTGLFNHGFEGWIVVPKGGFGYSTDNGATWNRLTELAEGKTTMFSIGAIKAGCPDNFSFRIGRIAAYSNKEVFVQTHAIATNQQGDQPQLQDEYTLYNYETIRNHSGIDWNAPITATGKFAPAGEVENKASENPDYEYPSSCTRVIDYDAAGPGNQWMTLRFDTDWGTAPNVKNYASIFPMDTMTGENFGGLAFWVKIPKLGKKVPMNFEVLNDQDLYVVAPDLAAKACLLGVDGKYEEKSPAWHETSLTVAGFEGWLVLPKEAFVRSADGNPSALDEFGQSSVVNLVMYGTSESFRGMELGAIKAVKNVSDFCAKLRSKNSVVFSDGEQTISQSRVAYGDKTETVAIPANPLKESDVEYNYSFSGKWYKNDNPDTVYSADEIAGLAITEDTTFTAVFSREPKKYTVAFLVDGLPPRVMLITYGETPVFEGKPTKEEDENYTYAFVGWSKEISAVTGNDTYTAVFTKTAKIPPQKNAVGIVYEEPQTGLFSKKNAGYTAGAIALGAASLGAVTATAIAAKKKRTKKDGK